MIAQLSLGGHWLFQTSKKQEPTALEVIHLVTTSRPALGLGFIERKALKKGKLQEVLNDMSEHSQGSVDEQNEEEAEIKKELE